MQTDTQKTASYSLPSIHTEGIKFVTLSAAITLLLWFALDWTTPGWLMAGVTLWVACFFRDPVRRTPSDKDLIIAPADGFICHIAQGAPPEQLRHILLEESVTRISIFMSVFDVHINRSPVSGTVKYIHYVPGKFLNADLDKASEDNERQYFVVEGENGTMIGFTQIAGLIARRILKLTQEGEKVLAGQRIGLIRFGSRVDVYLPKDTTPAVAVGQRAIAGETILGRIGTTTKPIETWTQ